MFWWWGPWGWIAGLIGAVFWIALIVGAVVLLRRELPAFQHRLSTPPALRLLEERYARGEIARDEFLHRRAVLLTQPPIHQQPPPAPPPTQSPSPGAEPTQPLPSEPPPSEPAQSEPPSAEPPPDPAPPPP